MQEKTLKKLIRCYYFVFGLLILMPFVSYFLTNTITVDSFSGKGIVLQTIAILMLLICIPLGLKTFSMKVRKLKLIENEEEKLAGYLYWSKIRLLSVALPLLFNVLLYCLLSSRTAAPESRPTISPCPKKPKSLWLRSLSRPANRNFWPAIFRQPSIRLMTLCSISWMTR